MHHDTRGLDRRRFITAAGAGAAWLLTPRMIRAAEGAGPVDDPLAALKLAWTGSIPWANVVDVSKLPGDGADEKLANAQAALAAKGGGVAYFPAGTYKFKDSIKLLDGVVLRGAAPGSIASAKNEKFTLETRFEFPKYEPGNSGDGTPIITAFKGIYLATPATASNCGVVHIAINRGHVHLKEDEGFKSGANRVVYGCVIRNAAQADPAVPYRDEGQKPWQRFTNRFGAAIIVYAQANALVANNRLAKSGEDNFTMDGYVMQGRKKEAVPVDGVVFDFDNRPGIYVNHYNIGGAGGNGPDGTPESNPEGFRKGIVIRDNFIFNTGRLAIGFCGDGVTCRDNVVRIPAGIWRPTATGRSMTWGSSTNDNRAVEARGWRWVVDGNDYEVHRNWAWDRKYLINDGEGIMHEDHANSIIKDSVLTNNRGNTYLSMYKTAGVDGLQVEGNEIRLNDGKQTIAAGAAIFVEANRVYDGFPCRNVQIVKNTVAGGGIVIAGTPGENNSVKGNKADGMKQVIKNQANARLSDNTNFDVDETPWQPKKRK